METITSSSVGGCRAIRAIGSTLPTLRLLNWVVKPGMGFFSFETAGRTLQGYETMHMIRKGQMYGVGKGDIKSQVTFIANLFGVAA